MSKLSKREPGSHGDTVLELSAKQTADWLAGKDPTPWTQFLVDDELRNKFDETKFAIRQGIQVARRMGLNPNTAAGLRAIAKCLEDVPNSPRTMAELGAAVIASRRGDMYSYEALRTKLAELVELGFSDA